MYCAKCDRTEWDQIALEMGTCSRCYSALHSSPDDDHYEPARPETRDIGVVGPVDGMNNLSAQGPYFRIVLMKGDNQQRSEYLISKGAAENLRDELRALLAPPLVFDDGPTAA